MNRQLNKSVKVCLIILVFFASTLRGYSQKPPTGGPNPIPPKETNPAPIIYAAGGIVLGAATYFYVKSRGPKMPVQEYLSAYLLNRNILPTPDAVDLIYELNPRLNKRAVIRAKKTLINPDFPEIPGNLLNATMAVQITAVMPASLKEQVDALNSSLDVFRKTGITMNSGDKNFKFDEVHSTLNEIERNLASPERNKGESNAVKNQLITDLLKVLNQTLKKSITTKILDERETVLIKEISENLSELLFPVMNQELVPEQSNQIQFRNLSGDKNKFLASVDADGMIYENSSFKTNIQNDSLNVAANKSETNNTNLLKAFAFAVHKIDSGKVITKGPEVEGKYLIKYVSPALKDYPDAYHNLSPLATYASAYLPPAKLFIIVEDINGKQVEVSRPLIDFKEAFKSPQREQMKDIIIVTINVTND